MVVNEGKINREVMRLQNGKEWRLVASRMVQMHVDICETVLISRVYGH